MRLTRELPPDLIPTSLWGQFVRQSPRYGVGLLLVAAYQGAQYWFDTRIEHGVDAALRGDRALALQVGAILVGLALVAFAIRVASRVAIFNGGRIAEYELRKALVHRLQQLGPGFYRRLSTGEIMSRATNDLGQLRALLGFGVLSVANTTLGLASALAVMLPISGRLTLASLCVMPALMLVTWRFSRRMYRCMRDNQDAIGRMSARVQTSLAGVRVVRSFALEASEQDAFEAINRDYLDKNLALARLRGSMGPIMQAVVAAGLLVVFWYGGHLMLRGELGAGAFLAFHRAFTRMIWPLIALGFVVSLVQRGRAAHSRLVEIYRAEPEIVDGPLAAPERIVGRLEVRHLSFAHGRRTVLDDVSFEVPSGGSLAVVGRTGSGKSTLAELLLRLLPTPPAAVFLDGHDVCDLPLATVRGAIGYAKQSAFLFSTTAGRNVGYALDDPDSPPARLTIREAAAAAHVLDELVALPDGLDTVVGERGVQLSGGQRQRVALARAFVHGPPLLVLDDPLSAVDARTERHILEAIDRQRAERTVILITSRVAAAARCDQILLLEAGRVAEGGTHQELVARGGRYARLVDEQRLQRELEQAGDEALRLAEGVPA